MNTSIEFFYQSESAQLPQHLKFSAVLKLKIHFLRKLYEALYCFYIENNFDTFDPHVGDWACQIRAFKLSLIKSTISNSALVSVKEKLEKIQKLILKLECAKLKYSMLEKTKNYSIRLKTTLSNFLLLNKYYINLCPDDIFIYYTRHLSEYKSVNVTGKISFDLKLIAHELNTGMHSANSLIHSYQKRLTELSCNFIKELNYKRTLMSIWELNKLQLEDKQHRKILPCFLVTKTILQYFKAIECIIVLRIRRVFNGTNIDEVLLPVKLEENGGGVIFNYNSPSIDAIIFECVVEYKSNIETREDYISRLLKFGIEKAILCNMAAHPQYPCINTLSSESEDFMFGDEYEYFKFQSISCHKNDSPLIFIFHFNTLIPLKEIGYTAKNQLMFNRLISLCLIKKIK